MEVEGQPSGMGWLPDGSLLVVSMLDHRVLRRSLEGSVSVHADVSEFCTGHLNDMVVSADGRAYAGNFGFDLMGGGDPVPAALIRVDPDGSASVAAEDLLVPERLGHHPGRRHADRGGDRRRPLHRLHHRGRRLPDRPPHLGPGRPDAGVHDAAGDAGEAGVRPRRLRARRRGPHLVRRRGRSPLRPRGAGRRDRRRDPAARRASTSSPACSEATTAGPCSCARPPTSPPRHGRRTTKPSS